MNGICTQDSTHPYSLAYYNCWHGLGHGLTIRFTQDIFHALRFCNVITRSWERQSCYSGVFMQNIVANGSGMHRAIDLKPSDPIYPCDAVTEQEKPSCYLMQTSYVLQVKKWNLPVAFRICDHVEARYVGTCYRSMGRDISGAALLDPGTVVSQCGMGAPAHRGRVHRRRGCQRRLRPARPHAWPTRSAGSPATPEPTARRVCAKATERRRRPRLLTLA